jgi:4-hydroxybenzoate polyprenyltransferase
MTDTPRTVPVQTPKPLLIRAIWREARPHQWVKNAFVVAPLVFAGPELLRDHEVDASLLIRVVAGFVAFCLASSATYFMNDIHDLEADRGHPVKRMRPIAAGLLPIATAWRWFWGLLATAGLLSLVSGPFFLACVLAYFLLNAAYSKGLKHVAYVDALVISGGFLLRVVAGGAAAQVSLSGWLIACMVLLSMFLALGKRKHELRTTGGSHRASLGLYRESHLNLALAALAVATTATYLGYTLDPGTAARFHTHLLPWTVPFPLFGLWRFMRLMDARDSVHSPTERMLRDLPFTVNLASWSVIVVVVIYGLLGAEP